jgi:hypothetical protein
MNRRNALLRLALACFAAAPALAKDGPWQEGVLVSRKTLPPADRHSEKRYLYRVRGGGAHYLLRLDQPLKLEISEPVKFSIGRKHALIRDADGVERRAVIVEAHWSSFALR